MKKIFFVLLIVAICIGAASCGARNVYGIAENTPKTGEQTSASEITEQISDTGAQIRFDPENKPAETPVVTVELDGKPIEMWNALLCQSHDGHISDGYIMFMDPPYEEFPEFELCDGMRILIDGAEKTSVAIRDAETHSIIGKCDANGLAENIRSQLGAGRYIVVFDAKNVGTGEYENDFITYSYYMFVNVK